MSGQLGQEVPHVFIGPRGGGAFIVELPWSSVAFSRRLDDMSDGSVSVAAEGLASDDCCAALNDLKAWQHELVIWRDDLSQWLGPVTDPVYESEGVSIPARDLFEWFERRLLPYDRTFDNLELSTIFNQYVTDALAHDTSPNITVAATPTGITGDRKILASERRRAADELRELSRTGLDFTFVGRTLHVGGVEIPASALAILTSETVNAPKLTERGSITASEVTVLGATVGTAQIIGTAGGVGADTGLVQLVFTEESIRDNASAQSAAQTRLDLLGTPPKYLECSLVPESPISLADLIPGARVDVAMNVGCKEVIGAFRLLGVDCSWTADDSGISQDIKVTLEPTGTVE